MPNKQELLDQIRADILKNNICPDLAKQATNLVMGDGNSNADIVFIGEAPGKNEDLQGKPFVGASGKFLNEMLASIGLERGDVYITNIVKYRPPENRDPTTKEKKDFLPYLQRQLEVIAPKVVITLGRHSANCFLPDLQISKSHGQPVKMRIDFKSAGGQREDGVQGEAEKRTEPYKSTAKGVSQTSTQQPASKFSRVTGSAGNSAELTLTILPLYHPAAALYNGGMRQTLLDDFSVIPNIIKKII